MKFGKELEDELVPEWRLKYLNYKQGKKKIKAVSRAYRNASSHSLPKDTYRGPQALDAQDMSHLPYTHYDFTQRGPVTDTNEDVQGLVRNAGETPSGGRPALDPQRSQSVTLFAKSPPFMRPDSKSDSSGEIQETAPLNAAKQRPDQRGLRGTSYGSIIGSPPTTASTKAMPALELPGPAIHPSQISIPSTPESDIASPNAHQAKRSRSDSPNLARAGNGQKPFSSLPRHLFGAKRTNTSPQTLVTKHNFPQSRLKRMFSAHPFNSPASKGNDIQLDAYQQLDAKQDEFFGFLDLELHKIEAFYRQKEDEASERLDVLREQLHELRDRRMVDIQAMKRGQEVRDEGMLDGLLPITPLPTAPFHGDGAANGHHDLLKPVENIMRRKSHVGKTSRKMEELASPTERPQNEDQKDYTRRNHENQHVPYRFAKRRLKLALQEFYRGLELLKSYALLNRTGFRKINKKYDKAVHARPPLRYMNEKVNEAHFVQSNIVEGHLVAVEDLYARYFERGNHKIAVGKLRTKLRQGEQSSSTFRNGLFVAAAIVLAIQGVVNGTHHLSFHDPTISTQASYLMQLHAGYFLALLLFLIFTIDCWIWTSAKINYVFIFEYDTRDVLDWREMAEIPCFFLFLNGFFLYMNFRKPPTDIDGMYLFWPLTLIILTLLVMCVPFPILYPHARKWWGFSNWRLLLAGLYPVEFRDFYLGDMYCSETYAMSQIELFFCLYVNNWSDPPQCNSNHSRLLGFFTTLPAIWRAFQCLRRYYDSRNWFPHLANCAKYCCNITYYMILSMYRINKTGPLHALFIVFAAINAIYCSFWDVAMDFSLGNPYARYPFLRDRLGYRRVWVYYVAAVLDVILRQQWIVYAIFAHDLQHSAALSFFVGLAEVLRRGMWSLFRVENEHCNNVGKFRASRDIPLPYSLPGSPELEPPAVPQDEHQSPTPHQTPSATGVDIEGHPSTGPSDTSLRRRRTPRGVAQMGTLQRMGSVIAQAHSQDFEKRKRADDVAGSPADKVLNRVDSSDDDEEEDHAGEDVDVHDFDNVGEHASEVAEAQRVISRGQEH